MIFAYILIIIGLLFFLRNAGIISWSWNIVWPLLLIGIGVYIGVISRRMAGWWHAVWEKISKKLE